MRRLLWLYPRRWRRRYGAEMEALLEEMRPTPANVLDLVRGALDARFWGGWREREQEPWRPSRPSAVAGVTTVILATVVVVASLVVLLGHPLVQLFALAAVLIGMLLPTVYRRLRRRRRLGGGPGPGEGSPVPAKPAPDAPPALTAASPGSGTRSGRD